MQDLLKQHNEEMGKGFEEKFLYWVVLGSTLNDGSALRWKVREGSMPDIEDIKSFILSQNKALLEKIALGEIERLEKAYGKLGSQSGRLGYQGVLAGVSSFGTELDSIRDTEISHWQSVLKELE